MGTFATPYDWLEAVGSRSPVQISVGEDGTTVIAPYIWEPTTAETFLDELDAATIEVLGNVEAGGDGSLHRSLPKASPYRWFCFASRIISITGEGSAELVEVEEDFEAPLLVYALAVYSAYRFIIEFKSRPDAMLSDSSIDLGSLTWYAEDGTSSEFVYATEWWRFTDYDYSPSLEIAYAQHGQMTFQTAAAVSPPHNKTAPGFPKISVPKATVRFRWRNIPYSYVESPDSFIVSLIGLVNQSDWYGFPAGSLLYTGANITHRYPPPIPEAENWTGSTSVASTKICSVEFMFEYTARVTTSAAVSPQPNLNWIAAGHNLLPFLGPQTGGAGWFYGVRKSDTSTKRNPTYASAPFQALFTDPDA